MQIKECLVMGLLMQSSHGPRSLSLASLNNSYAQISAAPGCAGAVAHCGGLRAVLAYSRVRLDREIPPPAAVHVAAAASTQAEAAPSSKQQEEGKPAPSSSQAVAGGAQREPEQEVLYFPLSAYEEVLRALERPPSVLSLLNAHSGIPLNTLRAYRGTFAATPDPATVAQQYRAMPSFVEATLLPFQREGVRFGLERGGRVLIADEM